MEKNKYIERALNMECIACGKPMISNISFFEDGYHIQLCSECRDKYLHQRICKKEKERI